jgi:hypothetical protein
MSPRPSSAVPASRPSPARSSALSSMWRPTAPPTSTGFWTP